MPACAGVIVLPIEPQARPERATEGDRKMAIRSPRTILALSAAMALTVGALAPTAALAKGPNGGGGGADCDGDCTADAPQAQQIRARDGSGTNQAARTKANAGGGGQVRARAGGGAEAKASSGNGQARNTRQSNQTTRQSNRNGNQDQATVRKGQGRNARNGAGQGPNEDGQRGPGSCGECDAEMGTLTDEQVAGLIFMANEEKLAHDVYAAFAEQYGVPIFSNIAESEATHQRAVNVVLERYGLDDTAIGLPAGEFSDPAIAALYDTFIEQGSASLEEAIGVGVLIEETDIADLESRMEDLVTSATELDSSEEEPETSAPDVYELYSHLLAASQNHLSAFEGWL
jgi:hypothetical protein